MLNTYGCDLLFIAEPCLLRQQGKWTRETLKMLKRPYLLAEKVGELEHVDDQNGQTKALHVLHVYHEDESRPLTILSRHPYCSLNSFDLNVHCLIVLFSAAVL